MAKDDIDLDNLDYEDFDYGISDYDDMMGDETPDRTPMRTAVKDFGKSVGASMVSAQGLLRTSKQVLPDSYGKAVNLTEDAIEGLESIYHKSSDDLRKSAGTFRNIAKTVEKKIGNRLPSIVSDKLKEFAEGGDSYQWGSSNDSETIASELSSVFGEQMDQQAKEQETTREEQRLSTAMSLKQSQHIGVYSKLTAESVNRLVSYQDNVLNKFQRKTLELQYKQFFLQKELTEKSINYFTQQIAFSKGIEKNTGLPDAQKLQKSELMAHTIKQRFINSSVNKASEFAGKFTDQLYKNVSGYASGIVGGITQGAEMYDSMSGLMDGFTPEQKREFMAQQAGGKTGEFIRERVADRLAPLYDKFAPQSMKDGFHKLNRVVTDPYALADEIAKSPTKYGRFSGLINWGKSMLPTYNRDNELQYEDQFTDADEDVRYDRLSRRSITQIIPEYLSQIARWTKATFTGVDDGEMGRTVYDNITGEFTSKSDAMTSIRNRIFNKQTLRYDLDDLNRLVNEITGGQELTPDAYSLLRRQLLDDSSNNLRFNPAKWGMYEKYTVVSTPEAVDELVGFFRARYNIDADGKMGTNTTEIQESIDSSEEAYVSFKNRVSIPTDQLRALSATYGKDFLTQMGLLEKGSVEQRATGRDTLNYDRIWDLILGENDADTFANEVVEGNKFGKDPVTNSHRTQVIAGGISDRLEHDLDFYLQTQSALQENLLDETKGLRHDLGFFAQEQTALQERMLQKMGLGSVADKVECDDPCFAAGSPLLNAIESLQTTNETQERHLESIFTIMAMGNLKVGPGGAPTGTALKWIRDKAQGVGDMTSQYFRFWGRQYRRALTGAKDLAPKALGAVKEAGRYLLGSSTEAMDVYVKGRVSPILLGRDIKAGLYRDRKTDKVINALEDIHGEVIDVDGNIVLTQEDYDKGLITGRGTSIALKGWSLAKGYFGAAYGIYGQAGRLALDLGKKAWESFKEHRDTVDLYVRGKMQEPVLMYHKLRRGEYFDEDGKVMTKWSDIRERVYDIDGNLVIKMSDIIAEGGFVDVNGRRIRSAASKVLSAGKSLLKGTGRAVGGYLRGVGRLYSGIGRGIGRMLGGLGKRIGGSGGNGLSGDFEHDLMFFQQEQAATQENILEQLKLLVNKGKPAWNDRGGDGVRDGSAADIRAKRKAEREAKRDAKEGKGGKGGKGGDGGDGEGRQGLTGKATSWLAGKGSMLAGAAGAALWSGAGALASGAVAAGGALWTGVAAVGTAIGGTIGLPALAIGAAVVGVGYGAWKIWERYSREDAKLLEHRMAQYGIHFSDKKEVSALLEIEKLLEPFVEIREDGTGSVSSKGETSRLFLEHLGVNTKPGDDPDRDEHVERIAHWYVTRFQPVFVAHIAAKRKHAPDIGLHELDAKISGRKALKYLEDVKCEELIESGAFDDMTSPFKNGWVFNAKLSEKTKHVNKFHKVAVKFFSKKAADEPEEHEEPGDTDVEDVDDGGEREDSKLMRAAKVAAMTHPLGIMAKVGKSLFDKVTGSSLFKAASGLFGKFTKKMAEVRSDIKDAVVSTVVPSFVRDGWNSLVESKPDPVELVRFMTYGLKEVDGAKIQLLRRMEQVVLRDMDEQGNWSGDPNDVYASFSGRFKIKGNSASEAAVAWKSWFVNRFIPTLGMTMRAAKALANVEVVEIDKSMSPEHRLEVATSIIESVFTLEGSDQEHPVWEMEASPWPGYIMNTDKESTAPVIAKIQDIVDGKGGGFLSSVSSFFGFGKDKSTPQEPDASTPSSNAAGVPNTAGNLGAPQNFPAGNPGSGSVYRGGAMGGSGAGAFEHPGKGSGGNINNLALPNGMGWEKGKDTIIGAAKVVGIDPALAASIAGLESSFDPAAGAGKGSAKGYFQVVEGTWDELMRKHAKKYGIAPGTSPMDPRANALLGSHYIKDGVDNVNKILKGSRPATDVDVYFSHFFGPGGVKKYLESDPSTPMDRILSTKAMRNNASVMYDNGRVRTAGEIYQEYESRISKWRAIHGLSPKVEPQSGPPSADDLIANVTGKTGQPPTPLISGLGGSHSATVTTGVTGTIGPGMGPAGGAGGSSTLDTGPVGSVDQAIQTVGKDALRVTLQRDPSTDSGTYGKITLPDGSSLETLELGWRNNKPRSSCIPAGTYPVRIKQSRKFGRVYRLDNVPGRSEILIHAGNTAGNTDRGETSDVLGCILLGTNRFKKGRQPAVGNSRDAVKQFMTKMGGAPFILTIIDGGVTQATLDKEVPQAQKEAVVTRVAAAVALEPTSAPTQGGGSGMGGMVEVPPSVPTPTTPREAAVTAAMVEANAASLQARSRDQAVEHQLVGTESLIAAGNEIAANQLQVLEQIRAIMEQMSGGEPTKTEKSKSESQETKVSKSKVTTPSLSGISFGRKKSWIS